jgi:predicted PurR-regulated permease PerM
MRRYSISSEKYFILIISAIFIMLTFFVIKDVFALIIYSMIISYFISPLYNYYESRLNNKRLSSLLTLITVTLGLFIPILFLFYFLALNLFKIVLNYKIYIENPEILNEVIDKFLENFTGTSELSSVNFSEIIRIIANYTIDFATNFMLSIPETILYFFIVLFICYYLLIHSETIFKTVNEYIPLTLKKQNEILRNITKNLKVLFRGYFLTGLIQTLVAAIIYVLVGAPNATILIFLTFITSLIPYVGTPLVWVPVGIFMIFTDNALGGYMLIILGALIISTVDNFLRPVLMSDKDTVPPPLVFIGFIGGMLAFGIEGIILGPIIISITSILLRYVKEYYELKDRVY